MLSLLKNTRRKIIMQESSSDNLVHHYNIKILNLLDPKLQLIINKPVIKSKLKNRSSHSELFLVKGVLKICSKCTGKHPCRSVISMLLKRVVR